MALSPWVLVSLVLCAGSWPVSSGRLEVKFPSEIHINAAHWLSCWKVDACHIPSDWTYFTLFSNLPARQFESPSKIDVSYQSDNFVLK